MLKLVLPTCLLTVFAATALGQQARPLQFRTIALRGGEGGIVAVIQGEVRLVNSSSVAKEWTLRETSKGWTIQSELAPTTPPQARYLSLDREGKVTLVPEPDSNAFWRLTREGTRLSSFDATIQATAGKFKDWYLGFADQPEQVEQGRVQYICFPAKLSEKAGARTKLYVFIDSP